MIAVADIVVAFRGITLILRNIATEWTVLQREGTGIFAANEQGVSGALIGNTGDGFGIALLGRVAAPIIARDRGIRNAIIAFDVGIVGANIGGAERFCIALVICSITAILAFTKRSGSCVFVADEEIVAGADISCASCWLVAALIRCRITAILAYHGRLRYAADAFDV